MFGDRLKLLRTEKDITQKDLGKIIGVSDRVIGYYESNDRFPKDEKILREIAKYFNVSTDYLLGLVDNPNVVTTTNRNIPIKFQDIRIEYLALAKEMQDEQLPPEDVKKILDVLKKHT